MQREEFFVPDSVNIENLDALSIEQSIVFEKKICEMAEISADAAKIVTELLEGGFGIYECLGFLSDGLSFSGVQPHENAMPQNTETLKNYLGALSSHDKAVFSLLLTERLGQGNFRITEADFLPAGDGDAGIIYVKNRLSDEAYDVFSESISGATVAYVETLREAAEAVSEGKKEFAILPLEERGGVRLASVAALLFKYDLKIASVTPVFGFDGMADVKYALVSRRFKIPPVADDDDRYLEIRLRADGPLSLSALFTASDMFGASVYRINTVRFEGDEGEAPYYTIVFKDEGCDFSALLVFLTLFAGPYTAIGIYKNLE